MIIIIDQKLLNNLIIFSSKFGKGIATFKKNDSENKEYNVEIDIVDNLQWGQEIKISSKKYPLIILNGYINTIVGELESIDNDGYSILRMENSIIPFYASGTPFEIGSIIEINVKNIVMTPYD